MRHLLVILSTMFFAPVVTGANIDIFWTDTSSGTIYRMGTPVISGRTAPRGITSDGNSIYWTEPQTGGIYRADLDGACVERLFAGSTVYPWDVAIEDGTLYWTDRTDAGHGGSLKRGDLITGQVEELYSYPSDGLALPEGLEITGDWAYVISKDSHSLDKYWVGQGVPGEPVHQVIPVDSAFLGPGDVAVSPAGRLYYGDEYGDALWSSNLDGSDVTRLLSGMGDRWGVDVVGGRVYWAESKIEANPGIYSMNLDGSDIQQEYAVGRPYGLFVIPEPTTVLLFALGSLAGMRRLCRRGM